jgi:hypothetical protein
MGTTLSYLTSLYGTSPHFSPNRVHWGPGSERIVLQPRFFSNS